MRRSWVAGSDGVHATATLVGKYPPETTATMLDKLRMMGSLGSWSLDGDVLTLRWPIGATPGPNPFAGMDSALPRMIPFGPHNPDQSAERTAEIFMDRILSRVVGCLAGKK